MLSPNREPVYSAGSLCYDMLKNDNLPDRATSTPLTLLLCVKLTLFLSIKHIYICRKLSTSVKKITILTRMGFRGFFPTKLFLLLVPK